MWSAWRHSSSTDGSGVLVIVDAMGISTWMAGVATLWIASVEDTIALTYDFHVTTVRQTYIKLGFVCLLDYFTFLTRSFTCLLRQLRITTRCRTGIQLHRHPLQHDGRIRGQRRDVVDSVLLSLVVNYIVLSCRTCFAFHVVNYIVDLL
jgi:hypothetical protein